MVSMRSKRMLNRCSSAIAPPSPLSRWLRLKPVAMCLIGGGVRQQIAGELLDGEVVERHVGVQRPHDPIAPDPLAGVAVLLKAVAVGIAGRIEPGQRHPLAIMLGLQQSIDQLFVSVGGGVGNECIDLRRRRRQAGRDRARAGE